MTQKFGCSHDTAFSCFPKVDQLFFSFTWNADQKQKIVISQFLGNVSSVIPLAWVPEQTSEFNTVFSFLINAFILGKRARQC